MAVKIHNIVTGELGNSLATSLLNSGVHPEIPYAYTLPYGFTDGIILRDGTVTKAVMIPVPVWLIEGADKTILIDTGLGDVDEVHAMQNKYGVNVVTSRGADQSLVAGLAARGVDPRDIDIVVITHCHFDHVGNNELFPNATFIVQKDELPQAVTPPSFCMYYYPEYSYKMEAIRSQLKIIDGDYQIDNAVKLVKIGGHTPGCMVVMVETDLGTVCLTSDIMYNYKNLELNWPTGSFWDLPALMAGYDRIRREADIIVPEHDWYVRTLFPSGTIG